MSHWRAESGESIRRVIVKEQESEASDRQGLPSHSSQLTVSVNAIAKSLQVQLQGRLCWVLKMLLVLVAMLFASEQISASILHLYGQTLPSGSEGSHQESHRGKRIYVSFFREAIKRKRKNFSSEMRRKNLPLTRLASVWENWLVLGEMFFF